MNPGTPPVNPVATGVLNEVIALTDKPASENFA